MAWTSHRTWSLDDLDDDDFDQVMNDFLVDNRPKRCEWCGGDTGRGDQCVHCGAPANHFEKIVERRTR